MTESLCPSEYRMLGAAGIAICILGLLLSFGWSEFKSPECHQKINTATMNWWNMSHQSDGKTVCDHGDDISTIDWWLSLGCGVLGLIFTYKGMKTR